jgi:hypothetical protein
MCDTRKSDTKATKNLANKKSQGRFVYQRKDGKWAQKLNNAKKPSSLHDKQKDAITAAKELLRKQGGGELTVQGEDGKIRMKDTIAPGNDPRNIEG